MSKKRAKKPSLAYILAALLVSALLCFSFAAADAYDELNYGGNDEPLLKGKGSKVVTTKDISATWFAGTTSVLCFVYTDATEVSGTVSYADSSGVHTSKWQIKDGGYGYVTSGTYQRSGSLSDNYAFITFYPKSLSVSRDENGTIDTGITLTIDSIGNRSDGKAGTASFDSIGFYVYADSATMNGRFLGSLSHLKKINNIMVQGKNDSVYDAEKSPTFTNYLTSGMADKMELSEERRINTAKSSDMVTMSKYLSGVSQSYTWGAKYKRQFVFTAKPGYRFDPKNIRFIFDGTDYSSYISVSVSNLNKTITVTFADSTAVYAKKSVKKVSFVNMNLSVTAGKKPSYTGYLNADGERFVDFTQCWKRSYDNKILTAEAEADTVYVWSAEFNPGNKFYIDGMPTITVNGNSLKLYSSNGFPATAKVSGGVLYLDIGGIKSSKGKVTPTPGIDLPDGEHSGIDIPDDPGGGGRIVIPDKDTTRTPTPTPTAAVTGGAVKPSVVPAYDDPNDSVDPNAPYSGEDDTAFTISVIIALLSLAAMCLTAGMSKKE